MPSRNVIKSYAPESYYHVYARGANKMRIFSDARDYHYFTALFERYLSKEPAYSKTNEVYPHFATSLDLLAFCLMGNHIHMLVHQEDIDSLSKFMRSLMTSYSRYFNLRHKRTGSLFESRYKASLIDSDEYLRHISRYIHRNPRTWETYRHSSLKYYIGSEPPEWLKPNKITTLFDGPDDYLSFVSDDTNAHNSLLDVGYALADG